MKLARLAAGDYHPLSLPVPRSPQAAEAVARVDAPAASTGDRERSLGEELASIEAKAIGEFEGAEKIRAEARDLAAQIAGLGAHADELLKPPPAGGRVHPLDDCA